jgi:hypothetical protein
MAAEIIYMVKEEWDKEEIKWLSDKIYRDASLFFKPERIFQTGKIEERCAAAIKYFEERLNYIYTRRHLFYYLEKVPFCLSLLKAEMTDKNIGNLTIITSADQDSPLPKEFQNGLFKTIKLHSS